MLTERAARSSVPLTRRHLQAYCDPRSLVEAHFLGITGKPADEGAYRLRPPSIVSQSLPPPPALKRTPAGLRSTHPVTLEIFYE